MGDKRMQVIIADDEIIERTALRKKLQRLFPDGLVIREAENGREVLALYAAQPADILVLDIEMPGVTGLEAAQTLRQNGSTASIIFLTAFDEFEYARKAITVRATDYLLKPCDDRELAAAIEEGMHRAARDGVLAAPGPVRSLGMAAPQSASPAASQQSKISEIIAAQYMRDLSVADVANELGYSEAYFCKLFRQHFGQSFVSYLTEYRIREAIRMLADRSVSIKDVGRAVGYPDPNYFAKVFRRVTGQSPTDYRASMG